jgi:hypothetical protein
VPAHVEHDPTLRRIWRNSALIAAVAAAAAFVLRGGRPEGALGVIAGAGLMAFSYRVIRQGVDARASRALNTEQGLVDERRPKPGLAGTAWTLTKYITRYGVIAVAAWAILVPLGASPVWMFVGVSVPVAAIAVEAVLARRPRRSV